MEKSKNRKVWQIIIAILTAIVLWVYVDNQVTTDAILSVKMCRWNSPGKTRLWPIRI